jgi:hypothetical protein
MKLSLRPERREDKARKAAKTIANYENRFSRIEADLSILKWMTGTILAGIVALVMMRS